MASEKILLIFEDQILLDLISRNNLQPYGYQVSFSPNLEFAIQQIQTIDPDLIIIEHKLAGDQFSSIKKLKQRYPAIPVILHTNDKDFENLFSATRAGVIDILTTPLQNEDVLDRVELAVQQRKALEEWSALESRRNTQSLQRRLEELDTLSNVGRSVTASFNIDNILATVVDAAVEFTQAEQGSLLLLDPETGELYMQAAKNIGEEIVKTFRIPAENSLAGTVIETGEPVLYTGDTPKKIRTAYLVQDLMYVPLRTRKGIIGVLGVDNQVKKSPFHENHLAAVSAIADYAAIALENAQLFASSELERRKLDTILTKVIDGVMVVDHENKVVFMNPTAREAFHVSSHKLVGRPIYDAVQHPELLKIFRLKESQYPARREIALENGKVLNVQATLIPEVGLAITMQDITQMKELDRIKSDFVSTVSHDLRSPLTAILGYIELLDRVGPLNQMQKEFVQRVHLSVQNITNLINDLLDLGRIEAGFDTQKEYFSIEEILNLIITEMREEADSKDQVIMLEISPDTPNFYASPTRIQQVLGNLIGNSIKYTQENGWIKVKAYTEANQLIIQVADNGQGIPISEQSYIFDRFFRASNTDGASGTGLGLAIVKSIVESHQGRVWVESIPSRGTTFTVVLPLTIGQALSTEQSNSNQSIKV